MVEKFSNNFSSWKMERKRRSSERRIQKRWLTVRERRPGGGQLEGFAEGFEGEGFEFEVGEGGLGIEFGEGLGEKEVLGGGEMGLVEGTGEIFEKGGAAGMIGIEVVEGGEEEGGIDEAATFVYGLFEFRSLEFLEKSEVFVRAAKGKAVTEIESFAISLGKSGAVTLLGEKRVEGSASVIEDDEAVSELTFGELAEGEVGGIGVVFLERGGFSGGKASELGIDFASYFAKAKLVEFDLLLSSCGGFVFHGTGDGPEKEDGGDGNGEGREEDKDGVIAFLRGTGF